MAGVNDFLKKLGLASPSYSNSPLDEMAPDEAPINQVAAYDDEDDMPALEEDAPVGSRTKLMSDADVAAIQSIPLPEAHRPKPIADDEIERELASAKEMSTDLPAEESDEAAPLSRYQELLKQYNDRNKTLNYAMAGNQLAQALAMKGGAKIGDGSDAIKALRDQNVDPLKKLQSEDSSAMTDAGSDVSKLYREQAYALLKKLNPTKNYDGTLENMSANQLLKLPGMKNALGTSGASPWIATDRVDSKGNPIRFNKATGEYVKLDGSPLVAGESNSRDITKRNPFTGVYELQSDQLRNQQAPAPQTVTTPDGQEKPKEYTYGDVFRANPAQQKNFDTLRDKFIGDMKDSREVATSVTNLASKLKPGPDNKVDSGLLGGIQTQAAKMAGQKGVLTDQDLVKFAGAGGVMPKIERIIDGSLFGEMSDSDVKFFKRFAQLMGKSLNEDIINRSEYYVDQAQQLVDASVPGVTRENVSKLLGVGKVAPVVQSQEKITSNSKELAPGEVRRKTTDGKIAIFDEKKKKFLRYEE